MAARPRRSRGKALRLSFWNADGLRGRRIELDHFLAQHGVDVCLLNETQTDRRKAAEQLFRSTCPGSEALGGNCHRDEDGWQISKDPGGLSFALPAPDQVGPYRLLERRAPCFYGG